jgi:ComF family protein
MAIWKQVLHNFLDLFLADRCSLCDRPTSNVCRLCTACFRGLQACQFSPASQFDRDNVPVLVWGSYGGSLKQAIAAMKYENHPQLAIPLGRWLAEAWLNSLKNRPQKSSQQKYAVVPIPMHPEKVKQRGFNQAELIAKSFCDVTGYPLRSHGLERIRQTTAQFGLSRQQRQQNLSEAIALGKDFRRRRPTRSILLLDDIYTTGTTCTEAAKALQKNQIQVAGILAIASSRPSPSTG